TRSNEFDDDNSTIASLFGLTIETCVKNKVNVAEALAKGTIKIIPRLSDIESDLVSTEDFADPEENLRRLPAIPSCMVCYDENIQGFNLACGQHSICIDCSRNLFQSAVRDTSLLPLRCCDVPIDMNISSWLLSPEDSNLIQFRMYEMSAREKLLGGVSQCSSMQCEVWDEDRLLAAGEARVNAEENRLQRDLPAPARQAQLQRAMQELQANEGCVHEWVRRGGNLGNCERCNYYLPVYGMRCVAGCGSTVCFTCASYRIPRRGWR
ncbi:hypothetical protein THAOC_33803, partial [Thalassiosira oceanica]